MVASGLFGLLIPGMEELENSYPKTSPLIVSFSFMIGGLLIFAIDKIVNLFDKKGRNVSSQIKLVTAISIHNIPEGLAVGFACGLALIEKNPEALYGALSLAIGIAIQNIPEGSVVSIPLYKSGKTKGKAFISGLISGLFEPVFAILGIFIVTNFKGLMPLLLVFASGSMIYVTIDELLPRIKEGKNEYFGLFAFIIGFIIMLILEMTL